MFLILLSSFFPFEPTMIKIVSKILPRKNEDENGCHMQSCWLVASRFCDDWLFYAAACKRVYFLCCIAMSKQ